MKYRSITIVGFKRFWNCAKCKASLPIDKSPSSALSIHSNNPNFIHQPRDIATTAVYIPFRSPDATLSCQLFKHHRDKSTACKNTRYETRRAISPTSSKNLFCVAAAGRVSRTPSPEAASPFPDKHRFLSPSCLLFFFLFFLSSPFLPFDFWRSREFQPLPFPVVSRFFRNFSTLAVNGELPLGEKGAFLLIELPPVRPHAPPRG